MPINIRTRIPEQSSAGFEVSFEDEASAALTPATIDWTLTNAYGSVINSRSAVSVTPTASTVTIVLSGDDLAWDGNPMRYLHVHAVYTSSLGSSLPLRAEVRFEIEKLAGVE